MEILSTHQCHEGTLGYYKHASQETSCDMRFTLFLPPQAKHEKVPVLFYLAGLTCTEENFTIKAAAYKKAAELGLAIIAPDTSPRGDDVPDDEAYDLGKGAGFYVDATQAPWSKHYRMESYIAKELPALLEKEFPQIDINSAGIFGHSMGGHGALTLFFRHRAVFRSVSAFAPICAPSKCPWGEKAFTAYLGGTNEDWMEHDACFLARRADNPETVPPILVDQGLSDQFLDTQLNPALFEEACANAYLQLNLRRHPGYDHSYFFIQSFMDDHLTHHAGILG
jgi:S-formylglutathione hydrolase